MAKAIKGVRFDCVIVDEKTGVVFKKEEQVRVTLDDGMVVVGKITDIEYNSSIDIWCKALCMNISIEDYFIAKIEKNEV